jgi:hypothetical protein
VVLAPAEGREGVREALLRLEAELRRLDVISGGGHTAAADMVAFYAATSLWFTAERGYKARRPRRGRAAQAGPAGRLLPRGPHGVRGGAGRDLVCMGAGQASRICSGPCGDRPMCRVMCRGGALLHAQGFVSPPVMLNMDDLGLDRTAAAAALKTPAKPAARPGARAGAKAGARTPAKAGGAAAAKSSLVKKYGPGFIWGQLNGWYKQTVYDPTASLSAERRGTVSLPDIESCYGSGVKTRYTAKARCACRPPGWRSQRVVWRGGSSASLPRCLEAVWGCCTCALRCRSQPNHAGTRRDPLLPCGPARPGVRIRVRVMPSRRGPARAGARVDV